MTPGDPFGLVGQVLDGQFRVDRFIGEGGFSIVYRGHHVGLDEPIAIKCLKLPAALGSALVDSFVRRFRDESRLHYRLSQGNLSIARSIASGTTMAPATSALVPYMVLEWLEGRSMAQEFDVRRQLGEKGRSLEDVVRLLDSAAQGIAYAHAQGVVHRDINPGNLFLAQTRQGQMTKVLDFGVAKVVSDHALEMGPRAQTIGQIRIFAPAYGAPEQFDDAMGKVGPQADVYSLALIALEALRDKPVREGEHLGEFALKALDPHLPTPRRLGVPVGDEVEQVFARALALKVEERPSDVGEFWGMLKHAMRVDAESGRPPYAEPVLGSAVDRWKPMPPAAGAGRPITADMPSPVVEVTRPGSVAPPADTRGSGSRQLHQTVRMANAPLKPGEAREPSVSGMVPTQQSGAAALASTPPLKSTLVMGNNPYGASRVNPSSAPSMPAADVYGGAGPSPVPPAYGPPPGAYGAPPVPSVPMAALSEGRPDLPTIVPERKSRRGLVMLIVVVALLALAAAAFGTYRVMAARSAQAPTSPVVETTAAVTQAPTQPAQTATPAPTQVATQAPTQAAMQAPPQAATQAPPAATQAQAPAAQAPAQVTPSSGAAPRAVATFPPSTRATPSIAPAAPIDPRAFNPAGAKASLDLVNGILASCRQPGGQRGDGVINVTFANDGTVVSAVIDEPPYVGTTEGQCVQSRFKHAKTTPFEGAPGSIVYTFHIPK